MNPHDAMTLESCSGHRTFQVVDYSCPAVYAALTQLSGDELVSVRLEPIRARGNLWRAIEVRCARSRPGSHVSTPVVSVV